MQRVTAPLFFALVLGCGGGADGNHLEPLTGSLRLLDFDRREFSLRYSDPRGFPIAGAIISCRLEGQPNGAFLVELAVVTDSEGLARFVIRSGAASVFSIVCRAVEGGSPARIGTSVAMRSRDLVPKQARCWRSRTAKAYRMLGTEQAHRA